MGSCLSLHSGARDTTGSQRHRCFKLPAAEQQGIAGLPDDLLIQILGALSLTERQQAACLACQAWHRVCHIPDLLQELAVYCAFNCPHQTDEECTQRLLGLRSLPPWLEQHGAALRSFTFSVHIGENVRLEPEHWREAQDQMPVAVMQAVGRGCAQLQHLSLDADRACNWFDVQPLLQPVSTLSSLLSLEVSGDVSHGALPFKGLTHLTRFKTAGLLTSDRAQALRQLPPSLLELDVTLQNYRDLPLGVPKACTRLSSLTLRGREQQDAVARGSLAGLPASVRCVTFESWDWICAEVLDSMTALPQLRELRLSDIGNQEPDSYWDEENAADLAACRSALTCLTQLSGLSLCDVNFMYSCIPAGLAELTGLQHLELMTWSSVPEACALPLGPWQHNLRCLKLKWSILSASKALIEAASGLTEPHLYLSYQEPSSADDWAWLWRWAEHAPALRLLAFGGYRFHEGLPPDFDDAVALLASSRPTMTVQCEN